MWRLQLLSQNKLPQLPWEWNQTSESFSVTRKEMISLQNVNISCDENKDAEKQKNTRMWESGFVQNEQPGNGQMQLW